MSTYPTSVAAFANKSDGVDTVAAAHINALQDEITAIETGLISGVQHDLKPQATGTYDLSTSALKFRDLYLSRDAYVGGVVRASDGAVGTPAHTFDSDPDTGFYRSGANALDFATGGVKALGIDSTQFVDSPTQPRCVLTAPNSQSIATGVATAVTFPTEELDVGGMHEGVTNPSRVTIPAGGDGVYLVAAQVSFTPNATGSRAIILYKNGVAVNGAASIQTSVSTDFYTVPSFTTLITLAAGDYLEIYAKQTSGGNMNIGYAFNRLSVVKLW